MTTLRIINSCLFVLYTTLSFTERTQCTKPAGMTYGGLSSIEMEYLIPRHSKRKFIEYGEWVTLCSGRRANCPSVQYHLSLFVLSTGCPAWLSTSAQPPLSRLDSCRAQLYQPVDPAEAQYGAGMATISPDWTEDTVVAQPHGPVYATPGHQ